MASFWTALIHLDPVALVEAGGYAGVALLVFAESGLLIGIFLPGDSLLFAAGLLAGSGVLAFWPLAAVVTLAALLGDSAGYWFGRKAGGAFTHRADGRFFKRDYLLRTEAFYAKYGPRAVVLARFVPIIRTIAPVFAGVGRMRYATFLVYNALGALIWGAGVVSLGYFLGAAIPSLAHYMLPISLGIIALSFLPIALNLWRGKRAL